MHLPLPSVLTVGLAALAAVVSAANNASGAESLLIRGAIIHTVSGVTLTNGSMLVRDGRIAALASELPPVPADVEIRLDGGHVYPGLIAIDTRLGLVEVDSVRATRDESDVGGFTPEVYSWVAVHPDSELIPVARANGFTHAEAAPSGGVISGHSSVIRLDGWTIEDMAVSRAAALHLRWPSFEIGTSASGNRTREEQARERERRIREIDEFFSQAEAYAKSRPPGADPSLPLPGESARRPEPRPREPWSILHPAWEAMLPAVRGEIPILIHADEARQIRSAVEWGVRRGYRIVIAGGRDAWRVADLLGRHAVPVAYEHVFTLPARDTDPYDVHFAAPSVLARSGVAVAFGGGTTRAGSSEVRNLPYAAAQAVAFGLPPAEALRGLTLHPARMLGLDDRLGSIEIGKDATFFIADGDILDIRTTVLRLWIQGREVPLESRHTRLYERYRARPRPE